MIVSHDTVLTKKRKKKKKKKKRAISQSGGAFWTKKNQGKRVPSEEGNDANARLPTCTFLYENEQDNVAPLHNGVFAEGELLFLSSCSDDESNKLEGDKHPETWPKKKKQQHNKWTQGKVRGGRKPGFQLGEPRTRVEIDYVLRRDVNLDTCERLAIMRHMEKDRIARVKRSMEKQKSLGVAPMTPEEFQVEREKHRTKVKGRTQNTKTKRDQAARKRRQAKISQKQNMRAATMVERNEQKAQAQLRSQIRLERKYPIHHPEYEGSMYVRKPESNWKPEYLVYKEKKLYFLKRKAHLPPLRIIDFVQSRPAVIISMKKQSSNRCVIFIKCKRGVYHISNKSPEEVNRWYQEIKPASKKKKG